MKIAVFLCVDGINFKPHHAEIFSRQLAGLADIFNIALCTALPRQKENFLHAAVGDYFHFMFNLLGGQLHAVDMIIAVKSAVHTVIFAIICYI